VAVKIIDAGLKFNGTLKKRSKTDYIILHHSASSNASVQDIHKYHIKGRGWMGIGYNFYIRKDGSIYRGRPENTVGAHAENYNNRSIGICAEGNYESEKMSDAQKQAIIALLRELKQKYPNAQIKRHKDFAATSCPGKNYPFDEIIWAITQPEEKEKEGEEVIKRGDKGASVKKIQEILLALGYALPKYGADGAFGNETEAAVNAFKRSAKLPENGIIDMQALLAMHDALLNKEKETSKAFEVKLKDAEAKLLITENQLNKYKTIVNSVKKLVSEV